MWRLRQKSLNIFRKKSTINLHWNKMKNEFSSVMANLTDAELIKMVRDQRNDFHPRAIEAAESEIKNRNLGVEAIQETIQEIEAKNQIATEKANEELDVGLRVLSFIFPGGLLIALGALYKSKGYKRKGRELIRWTLFGFGFYNGIFILMIVINLVINSR